MNVGIFCSKALGRALQHRSVIPAAKVFPVSSGGTGLDLLNDADAAQFIHGWRDLLATSHQETRFNSAERFLEGAAAAAQDGPQSLAMVFWDRGVRAVVSGLVTRQARARGFLADRAVLTVSWSGLCTDGSQEATSAVFAALDALQRKKVVDVVSIQDLYVGQPLHARVAKCLENTSVQTKSEVRYRRRLRDAESGEILQVNSSKTRQGLRRKERNLEKNFDGDFEFVRVTRPEETDDFVTASSGIVAQTYQAAIGIGVKDNDEDRAYLRVLASEGTLRGYLFKGQGTAIAYVLGDIENGTFHLWATSFLTDYAKFSPGIVLLNKVFSELAEEGVELFDFGTGEATYKQQLGTEVGQVESLKILGRGPASRLAYVSLASRDWLKARLRAALERAGLFDWLKKRWRLRLERSASS